MKTKCGCGKPIPEGRLALGYKVCVECSEVEAYGCVDVCYHKTGNTIQITDQATAARTRELSARSGYGIMRGLRAGKAPKEQKVTKSEPRQPRIIYRPGPEDRAKALKELGVLIDEGATHSECWAWIEAQCCAGSITGAMANDFRKIVRAIVPPPPTIEPSVEPVIPEEINEAFRNWKL